MRVLSKPFSNFKDFILLFILVLLEILPNKLVLASDPHPIFCGKDSLKSIQVKGQRVIVYVVEPKESFYSIARKYHLEAKTLMAFNPTVKSIVIGEQIWIPRGSSSITSLDNVNTLNQASKLVTVSKGETLFSIAQSNKVSLEELVKVNHLPDHSVWVGQKLIIPVLSSSASTAHPLEKGSKKIEAKNRLPNGSLLNIPNEGLYIVAPGETIYSIGFKYGVGVEEIRTMNQIQNNEIKVGQILKLKPEARITPQLAKETTARKTAEYKMPPESSPSNPSSPSEVKILTSNNTARRSRAIPREFKEEGMGIWVDNNDLNQARSMALHKQAPIGTVIKVTNPMTRKSIFVKVVGSFPETEETKNAVLVISKSAANLIGALDAHFRVELSYAF